MANASVTITGTPEAPVFNFDLPQGEKGDPGGFVAPMGLTTSDLNTVVAPGLYKQDNSNNATIGRNYPRETTGGIMTVYERVSPGAAASVIQNFIPAISSVAGSPITYIRYSTTNNTVWTPWRTFTSSRVDTAAGRAIYTWDDVNGREQLIYGDTGRRDVAASIEGGSTTTTMELRRVGQSVTLRVANLSSVPATNSKFYVLPVGFRPPATALRLPTIEVSNSITAKAVAASDGSVYLSIPTALTTNTQDFTWVTSDPWPTTLPGTAVGSIPNL